MAESPGFNPGDKQQEATHLHFQRPAQSASPPPGRAGDVRVYPRALRLGGSRGRPAQPSQAPTPTTALEPRGGGRAAGGQIGASAASSRASHPKWGQRGSPPLGLGYPRTAGSQTWAPRPGWAARTARGQGRGAGEASAASGGAGRGQGAASRPSPAPWPSATGSRAGGGRAPAARLGREASCPRGAPSRARGPRQRRSPRPPSRPRGQGRPRRRRPPLPPARRLLPPPAWRAAAATARAAGGARNGARLAASPGGGERGSCGARRPRARGPRHGLRDHPPARGAVRCGLSGPGPAEGPPPAPGSQRPPRKEGGRKRAAAISRRRLAGPPASPGPARPRPRPRLRSEPENKTRVGQGGASAAGSTGSARAAGARDAASWCQHGRRPLSFLLRKCRRAPEPRKAGFGGRDPPQSKGNEALGWGGVGFPVF